MNKPSFHEYAPGIVAFLVLGAGFLAANAFTAPTTTPPDGNVPAPLNTGSVGQEKAGGLILNTGGAPNGLIVQFGNVGIGTVSPSEKLSVNGIIQTLSGGFKFPGGSVQTVAATPHGKQVYTSNDTFIVPLSVPTLWVTAAGGGGGGGGGACIRTCYYQNLIDGGAGGGGGGGALLIAQALTVAPSSTHSITIGNGGSAGAMGACSAPVGSSFNGYPGSAGSQGGGSAFGSLLTVAGGTGGGGGRDNTGYYGGGAGGLAGGNNASDGTNGGSGGGGGGTYGGDGGNSIWGIAGRKGKGGGWPLDSSGGAGRGYGGGGGGGGGGGYDSCRGYGTSSGDGGAGSTGIVIVEW